MNNIKNFAIIAHIDHGKSTLSDRIISLCGGLHEREMKEQVLDSLKVERERGITVKAQAISLNFAHEGNNYILNLIDTPGHVDFGYEVRRSLSACEGALILVDATQRVQAQTLATVRVAFENNLALIPVLNKIDLPGANPEYITEQIRSVLGINKDPLLVSSKTGVGVQELLQEIVQFVPSPLISPEDQLQALVVDSWYDQHLGIVTLVRVYKGCVKPKMNIFLTNTKKEYKVIAVGISTPKRRELESLPCGMIGYVVSNMKDITDCIPGYTIGEVGKECDQLKGFVNMKPSVFCGIYPASKNDYSNLKKALDRLKLNDSAITLQDTNLPMLGHGFRCGFLGLLHLEVVQQRLVEEFGVDIVPTSPGVFYEVHTKGGGVIYAEHPLHLPDMSKIECIKEPWARVDVFTESEYIGPVIELCKQKRGVEREKDYIEDMSGDRMIIKYLMPLAEIIYDFHDKLKSVTRGYASFDYDFHEYQDSKIVPLTIMVQGKAVESLGMLIHQDRAESHGRWLCQELKEAVDRQLFPIAIQATIGAKIIARETVSALRKDVTAKCYGGDITRKKKLLEKQKEGKQKMKHMMMGSVSVELAKVRKILIGKKS